MPAKCTPSASQKMPPKLRLKLANDCENLLSRAKLNPFTKKYRFHLLKSAQLNKTMIDKMFNLFVSLMRDMYEKSSWGWHEEEKLAEWKNSKTRLIVVTRNDLSDSSKNLVYEQLPEDEDEIIGFMCFRFETGGDKKECVLYVYELHIDTEHQRQGLGEELMQMAKVLAVEFKMDKVMLTVFKSNKPALQFYNKLKFITDKSSPAPHEADYIILSSKLLINTKYFGKFQQGM